MARQSLEDTQIPVPEKPQENPETRQRKANTLKSDKNIFDVYQEHLATAKGKFNSDIKTRENEEKATQNINKIAESLFNGKTEYTSDDVVKAAGEYQRAKELDNITNAQRGVEQQIKDNSYSMISGKDFDKNVDYAKLLEDNNKKLAELNNERNTLPLGTDTTEIDNKINALTLRNMDYQEGIKFQNAVKEYDAFQEIQQNGTEEEKKALNEYYSNYNNNYIENQLLNIESNALNLAGSVALTAGIAGDALMEQNKKEFQQIIDDQYENGRMSDEDYEKVNDFTKKVVSPISGAKDIGTTLIDESKKIKSYQELGASNVENFIVDAVGSAVENLALQGVTGATLGRAGMHIGTALMSTKSYAQTYLQDITPVDQGGRGLTEEQARTHALFDYFTEFGTELIGGERFLERIKTNDLISLSIGDWVNTAAKEMAFSGSAEALEEAMGWAVSPIVDLVTTGDPIKLEDWNTEELAYAMASAFVSGIFMDSTATMRQTFNSFYNITTEGGLTRAEAVLDQLEYLKNTYSNERLDSIKADDNVLSKLKNKFSEEEVRGMIKNGGFVDLSKVGNKFSENELKEMRGNGLTIRQYIETQQRIISEAIYNFNNNSALGSAVRFINTEDVGMIDQWAKNIRQSAFEAMQPEIAAQIKQSEDVISLSQSALNITQEYLNQKGYGMISASEYFSLPTESRQELDTLMEAINALGEDKYTILSMFDITDGKLHINKNGEIALAKYDGFKEGQTIALNTRGRRDATSTFVHELWHKLERTSFGEKVLNAIKQYYGDRYDAALAGYKSQLEEIYGREVSPEEATSEFVAVNVQDLVGNKEFLNKLVKYDSSTAYRMLSDIKSAVANKLGRNDVTDTIIENYQKAFEEYKNSLEDLTPSQEKVIESESEDTISTNDIRNSWGLSTQIAERQETLWEEKGNKFVDEEVFKEGVDQMKTMSEKFADAFAKDNNLLPPDTVGKVLLSDASYGKSVENTTICPRTLAYNELIDLVQDKVGRPLTNIESFLVSQKLYEIGVDPQCLYCYVALDRKAYNNYLLDYIAQRDNTINNNLSYKEFLKDKNGKERKDTPQMKERYNRWMALKDSGKLITNKDLATKKSIKKLQNSKDTDLSWQVRDALKYAQSASWAKKQIEYRAYLDEIAKLPQRTVNSLNKHYGLRWYSFNDYSAAYIVENMQQITDAALRGLKGLGYTKDIDFAKIFAPTGMNINISIYATKRNGQFVVDPLQSADFEEAKKLREQYPNVGIVVTATSEDTVRWAMEQEWSDVVIPFHIVRTGKDIADYYKWSVYNSEQNDVVNDKALWEGYVESLTGVSHEDKDAFDKAKKKVSKMIYPSEHQNDYDTFIRLCEERGLKPRFDSFNPGKDATPQQKANYMKLVNETRLSEGVTPVLQPVFNMDAANDSFDRFVDKGGYYEGWYVEGTDVDAEAAEVAEDVMAFARGEKTYEEITEKYGEKRYTLEKILELIKNRRKAPSVHGRNYSVGLTMSDQTDSNGRQLSENMARFLETSIGDRVDPYDPNSKHMEWLHGTRNANFTVFDNSKHLVWDQDENYEPSKAIYLTSSLEGAKSYSGTEKETNPYDGLKKTRSVKDVNKVLEENGFGSRVVKIGRTYYLYGDIDDLFAMSNDMEEYYDLMDATTSIYEDKKTHKLISEDEFWDDGANEDDYIRHDAFDYDSFNGLLEYGLKYSNINRGNFKLYAKSENPLIVDVKGSNWNELPSPYNDGETITTREYEKYALDNGYDSIRYLNIEDTGGYGFSDTGKQEVLVVFSPNQVKSIYNESPTSNEDIRYSVGLNSKGERLTKDQEEYFKDSKARDENGNLLVLYHGTPSAGFTVFDNKNIVFNYEGHEIKTASHLYNPSEGEFIREELKPIFLTTSKRDADSYGGNDYDRRDVKAGRLFEDGQDYSYQGKTATINDILEHPKDFTLKDIEKALLTYDREIDIDGLTKDEVLDAMRDMAEDEDNEGFLDIEFVTNSKQGKNTTLYDRRATYELYANLVNPYIVDLKGSYAEDGTMNMYAELKKAKQGNYDGFIAYNTKVGRYKENGTVVVAFSPEQLKLTSNLNPTSNPDIRYSVGLTTNPSEVTNKKTLQFLNDQDHLTVYRAMLDIDGKLYPPMATMTTDENGKLKLQNPAEVGKWYQSEERPDLLIGMKGEGENAYGYYRLRKPSGKTVDAAYNPYFHTSLSLLNDQFTSAYQRPNLVVVKGEVPVSELTSGYKAQYAKDPVGKTEWHSGTVSSQLKKQGKNAREVILSRWFKPTEIISDNDVAKGIADMLSGTDIAIPFNVITRNVRNELEALGVPIGDSVGLNRKISKGTQYSVGLRRYSMPLEGNPIVNAKNDEERAEILKNMTVKSVEVDESKAERIDKRKLTTLPSMKKAARILANKLGLFKEYSNKDVPFTFNFSSNKLSESIQKTFNRNANKDVYDLLLSKFEDITNDAKLVEVHDDIYEGTTRENKDFDKAYVFLGAFHDSQNTYPVEMVVKTYFNDDNVLHMEVILGEIKKMEIKSNSQTNGPLDTSITYSLPDLISGVNDGDFLKYIPDQLLSPKQIESKNRAIEKEKQRIGKLELTGKELSDMKVGKKSSPKSLLSETSALTKQDKFHDQLGTLKFRNILKDAETWFAPTTSEAENETASDRVSRLVSMYENGEATLEQIVGDVIQDNKVDNATMLTEAYLLQYLDDIGEDDLYEDVLTKLHTDISTSGQILESVKRVYELNSPIAKAIHMKNVETNLQAEVDAKYGKGKYKISLEKYRDALANAKSNSDFKNIAARAIRETFAQLPQTLGEKLNSLRFLAMLSSPRTAVRNLVSNEATKGLYKVNNLVKAVVENRMKIDKSQRTATLKLDREASRKNRKVAAEIWDKIEPDERTKYGIKENFGRIPAKLAEFEQWMLDDERAMRPYFIYEMDMVAQARGIDLETIDRNSKEFTDLLDYVVDQTEEVVHHNATALSKFFDNLKRYSSKNVQIDDNYLKGLNTALKQLKESAEQGSKVAKTADTLLRTLQTIQIPFTKTTSSIAKKAYQFSPANLAVTALDGMNKVKAGKITPQEYVDRLSKGLTGTGLMAVAAILTMCGLFKWDRDDEDYSGRLAIKMAGDKYYTIDFLDPASITFAKGVALAQEMMAAGQDGFDLMDVLRDDFDIFVNDELNMFSSLLQTAKNFESVMKGENEYGDYSVGDFTGDIAFTTLNQFIPSIVRDISRIIHPNKKTVYTDIPAETLMRRLINNTPFRSVLPDKTNAQGEPKTYTQDFTGNNVFDAIITNLVSPGNLIGADSKASTSTGETSYGKLSKQNSKYYQDLAAKYPFTDENNDGRNDSDVWLRTSVPTGFYYDNEKVEMSAQAQQYYGQEWTEIWTSGANSLMNSPTFKSYDEDTQAKILYQTQLYANRLIGAEYGYENDLNVSEAQYKAYAMKDFFRKPDGSIDGDKLAQVATALSKVYRQTDENGKTISNSNALGARKAYEDAGIYDDIIEYIEKTGLSYSDFGLTKTVVKYSEDKAEEKYNDIFDYVQTELTKSSNTKTSRTSAPSQRQLASVGSVTRSIPRQTSVGSQQRRDASRINQMAQTIQGFINRSPYSEKDLYK